MDPQLPQGLGTSHVAVTLTSSSLSFTCVCLFYAKVLENKPISKQCDVYSYGIVVWELLTHKIPFEDTLTDHELHKVVVMDKKVSNLYS